MVANVLHPTLQPFFPTSPLNYMAMGHRNPTDGRSRKVRVPGPRRWQSVEERQATMEGNEMGGGKSEERRWCVRIAHVKESMVCAAV